MNNNEMSDGDAVAWGIFLMTGCIAFGIWQESFWAGLFVFCAVMVISLGEE